MIAGDILFCILTDILFSDYWLLLSSGVAEATVIVGMAAAVAMVVGATEEEEGATAAVAVGDMVVGGVATTAREIMW